MILLSLNDVPVWAWLLLVLGGALVVAWLVQRVILGSLRRLTKRTNTEVDDVVIKAIGPSLAIVLFVAALWLGLRLVPIVYSQLTNDVIDNTSFVLIAVAVAMGLARMSGGLLSIPARRNPRWQPLSTLGTRFAYILIYVLALLAILPHFGVQVTPLVASLGIAGLAVALGLSDTLANFFAGLWIQVGKSVTYGHLIELDEPEVIGYVKEIGWRTTQIQTLPNNVVTIPNQALARATITDYHLPQPRLGANLLVRVGFEADPDQVERVLLDSVLAVAKENPEAGILSDPPPSARLNNFADNGFEFWLGFQCRDWFAQHGGAGAIRKEIVRRFREAGIRLPYPMNEQYAVPANRIDIAQGLTSGAYVPETQSAYGRAQASSSPAEATNADEASGETSPA